MRRFVRDRVADAREQATPALEEYIAEDLQFPEAFPYHLAPAAMSIREFRKLKVTVLAKTDYPPIQVEALLKAWLSNRAVQIRGDWDPGILDVDVQLAAHGTVAPDGTYNVDPRSAVLAAWWRDMVPLESQRLRENDQSGRRSGGPDQ